MRTLRHAIWSTWSRLLAFGFRLLYNELAWLYDPVSWVVSAGRWQRWRRTVLPFLPPGDRVLEVGFGPGHLLADLSLRGYRPFGLDPSAAMIRQAKRRLRRLGSPAHLCRGKASALPFAPQAFAAIVVTFPTAFVYDPGWMAEAARVLQAGGRLVVVEIASFRRDVPLFRPLEWLYHITGQRGPAPDLPGLLCGAGLEAWREQILVNGSTVGLVLGEKRV